MAAATFTYPKDLSAQTQIVAADIKGNLDAVRNFLMGPNMKGENLSATAAITGAQIASGEIRAEAIAVGAIDYTRLAAYSVTESKLQDNAVTDAKLDRSSVKILSTGANNIAHCAGAKTATLPVGGLVTVSVTFSTDADQPLSSAFTAAPNVVCSLESVAACSAAPGTVIVSRATTGFTVTVQTPIAPAIAWPFSLHWIAEGNV